MKISTRLTITFLVAALVPLALVGFWSLRAVDRAGEASIQHGQQALSELGEQVIQLQAQAVAREVAFYLQGHSELNPADGATLRSDPQLAELAVVPTMGEKGYTAVFDDQAITHLHKDPSVVGADMSNRATVDPEFWALMSRALDGTPESGYYWWTEADGRREYKYMSIAPVPGTPLRVAATTYVEEFHAPLALLEEDLEQISYETRMQLLAIMTIVGILALFAAVLLAGRISEPIHKLLDATSQIAGGDLCVELPAGEVGELKSLSAGFGQMTDSICSLIRQVRKMTFSVGAAAGQVVATQRQHAESAEQQAAAIASAGSAVRELAATSAHIAATAEQMVFAASHTQTGAQEGVSAVADAAACLGRIARENEASVDRVHSLSQSAEQIKDVMDLIDDIAAQTRLIAFNASIEASAAGEAGRRFSVVASEVRRLADRVGKATEEIRTRLEEIGRTSNELMIASEREHTEIEAGLVAGQNATAVLEGILESAQETRQAVRQISRSIHEHNRATEQLEVELQPITIGSQAIAAGSQETVAVMEDLVARAEALEMAVRAFQLPPGADLPMIGGDNSQQDDAQREVPVLA
ncbi:MAG: HAMP domain-containing protein [Anaerolineae bacterium]|nr:HAMP domain-containing protein [Anaerolineae bacterium]